MGRSTLIALVFAAISCSGEDTTTPVQRPDGGQFCTAGSHTCPSGTRCVNSYCVPTCTGGAACPAGMYCPGPTFPDDVCSPAASAGCNFTSDCPEAQTCYQGRCISQEGIGDGGVELCTKGVANDKCAPDAVCYDLVGTAGCIGLPSCGQDGGCAAGGISLACNRQPDGGHIVQGKGAVCLLSECGVASDCKVGALCAHASSAVTYGTCQLGITGDSCAGAADCASAAVCETPDSGPADAGMQCRCVITSTDAGVCAGK
ncbi:MAG TPA: hypothetical protein VEP66_10635 [Myxococcales bacterium]|nr:hypothetical protein [Myxococcales bacterium]